MNHVLPILEHYHLLGMFCMLLACGFGFPLPEDVILISGGFLAQRDHSPLWPAFVVAYFGVIMGDSVMYWIGHHLGHRLLTSRYLRFIFPPERRERVQVIFQKWGSLAVLGGRFAAGFRAAIFLTAGAMRLPYKIFFICDTLAAIASVPLWILIGYKSSEHIGGVLEFIGEAKFYFIGGTAIVILLYVLYRFLKRPGDAEST